MHPMTSEILTGLGRGKWAQSGSQLSSQHLGGRPLFGVTSVSLLAGKMLEFSESNLGLEGSSRGAKSRAYST